MKTEIKDRYEPEQVESKWIEFWEKNNCFQPDMTKKESFCIVIPPPNITGTLHIGHALNHTLQDIISRIERKKGKSVLWVPGTDHAGIATQVVVERELLKKENKRRHDYTREEFIEKVWDWKRYSGGEITKQQRKLGESVDWSRERFTLDEGLSKAVIKVFKTLYDEGLIYRGKRIINWCPVTKTAISDIEVEYRETKGHLYHLRYPIKDSNEYIVVATTRPETMFGDMAVCANPDDQRYKHLKGRMLKLPLTDREIPILFDSFVDMSFGSGLVKITPAHDLNDFEAGQRLGLEPLLIMNDDGTLNENTGKYNKLDRFDARKKVIEDLQSLTLMDKIEDYTVSVGHNQRGGAVIEPYLSTQWFVKIKPLAEEAIQVVKTGKVQFVPEMWSKIYYEWMENIKDWCISRQLFWGHRIPAYYCGDCDHMEVSETSLKICPKCNSTKINQDTDVLDTWFSSGLWPFTTLGWPDKTEDVKRFYPNSILVTAFDIIFFWVARMIMMGCKFMGDVPFHKVMIHGLVRDKTGKKFSKSLGNTIDPLIMMKQYGTDSFRFFLAATLPEGKDVLFDESRLEGYRGFCNKIWNSSRFILMNLPDDFVSKDLTSLKLESSDIWIISKFNEALKNYEKAYSHYHFYEMAASIYEFIWGDFCDWYIELTKHRIYKCTIESKEAALQTLATVLQKALDLLHPFMPFITEEINSAFSPKNLTNGTWPEIISVQNSETSVLKIEALKEITTKIRNMRAELKVAPDKKCKLILKTTNKLVNEIIHEEENSIKQLARIETIEHTNNYDPKKSDSVAPYSYGEIVLPLSGMVDIEKEKARLLKEKDAVSMEIEKIHKKLSNPEFLSKAKVDVVEKEQNKMKALHDKIEILDRSYKNLEEH